MLKIIWVKAKAAKTNDWKKKHKSTIKSLIIIIEIYRGAHKIRLNIPFKIANIRKPFTGLILMKRRTKDPIISN